MSRLDPTIAVYEVPFPTTRTDREMASLRRAGFATWAIRNPRYAERVAAQGYRGIDAWVGQPHAFVGDVKRRLAADVADAGSAAARRARLWAEVLENPTPEFRPMVEDLNVRSRDWLAAAEALVNTPAQVYWAADLNALPPVVWAARVNAGSRVIFDSHELFPELDTLDPLQAPHWRDIAQRFVPQVDLVLTVSDGIARELRDRYRAVRVEVIDNLAATGGTPSDTVRSRLGLPETEPLIIHVGTVSPQRRPELAVDLLARLPEAHLAFVGEIRGGLEAPLRQRAERLGVAERLHVVDPVPLDELVEFLSDADAGVILSSPERSLNLKLTVPNKLYDYLAAGLPVVATAGLPPADIAVQERVGAAFVDGDVTSLAAAMRTVLGDDELRARARARRSEWTWALHEERLVRLVRQQAEQATLPSVHRDTAAAAAEPQHANNARSAFSARVRKAASWRLRRLAARLEP